MTRLTRIFRGLRNTRAAALLEFALVVPFLMMIMCATIDFGLAMFTLNNLTAAVREGGRFAAALYPAPVANDAAVSDRVYNYIVGMNNGLSPAQVRALITSTAPDPVTGNITVAIRGYPYRPMTPLATLMGLSTIPLSRQAIFRYERTS